MAPKRHVSRMFWHNLAWEIPHSIEVDMNMAWLHVTMDLRDLAIFCSSYWWRLVVEKIHGMRAILYIDVHVPMHDGAMKL